MQVVSKAVASIAPGADDESSEHGTFDVILSAQTLDRDGEVLRADEWKTPLPEHVTFDIDHGMTVASTVGSGRPFVNEDGDIQVHGTYSSIPRAQETRTLVNEGHIRTTSVTYLTTKRAKGEGGATVERELLNGSFVSVPANRDAIVLASKAMDATMKAGARNSGADLARIQAIHDTATELGASCAQREAADTGADDGANKSATPDAPAAGGGAATHKATGDTSRPGPSDNPAAPNDGPDTGLRVSAAGITRPTETRKPTMSTAYVRKALVNSVEDLQGRIADALNDLYKRASPSVWCYLQATFLDDAGTSGTIVYCLDGDSLSRSFTDDGKQVTLGDDVTDVTVITTILPEDAAADDDGGGGEDGAEGKALSRKTAVSDKPWSGFSQADYTLQQWKRACVVAPEGGSDVKGDYKLPIREPDGALNRNAVHAAAGRVHQLQGASKQDAARALLAAYKILKEDPPDSLVELAGQSPKGDSKSADPVAADAKSAAASADEQFALRAQALSIQAQLQSL